MQGTGGGVTVKQDIQPTKKWRSQPNIHSVETTLLNRLVKGGFEIQTENRTHRSYAFKAFTVIVQTQYTAST